MPGAARKTQKRPEAGTRAGARTGIRLRWDERGKLIAVACACGALLVLAMLLPLAFRKGAGEEPPDGARPAAEAKAAMFAAFWYGESGGSYIGETLTVEKPGPPDEVTAAFCEGRMAALTARCIDDQALSAPPPTGSDYTTLTGGDGETLRLCRMWLQARGDWQNWLDVCFDADTGRVYYLYVSRECLTNRSLYAGAERPGPAEIAALLAESYGGSVRHFAENADGGGTAIINVEGGGTVCYRISGVYYDALIDVRVNCV